MEGSMKKLLTILTLVGLIMAGSGYATASVLWGIGSPDWAYGTSGPSPVIFLFDTSTGTISTTFSFGISNGNFMWISGVADSGDYLYASHNIYDIAKSSKTHDFRIAKIDRNTGTVLSDTSISGFLGQTYSQVNALDCHDGKLYAVENATSESTIRGYAMEILLDANGDVTGATLGAYVGPYPDCGLDYHDGLWWATSWGYTPLGYEGSLVFTSPDIMNTAFTQVGTGNSAVEGIGMIDGWEFDGCGNLFAATWYNVPASSTAVYSINTSTWTATSLYDLSSQLPASITALDGLSNLPAPAEVWVDDDYCDGCSNGGHIWCYDAFNNIQDGIDAVAAGGTVNVAAGTYNVAATIIVNKPVSVSGPSGGGAIVKGTSYTDFSAFEIRASNVTIRNLEITHDTMNPTWPPTPPWNELLYAMIRIPDNLGLSGISITGNMIYVNDQPGEMSTWTGVGITVGRANGQAGSPVSITGNTIYNTRNGIVNSYGTFVSMSNNII